ncbi:MAG: ribonuclease R, partial [Alphaproteobacteria bacterium]
MERKTGKTGNRPEDRPAPRAKAAGAPARQKPDNKRKRHQGGLPSREDLIAYLEREQGKLTKREIARAFGVKGAERVALKRMLRELEEEGVIARDAGRVLRPAHRLPHVMVVEVTGIDELGDLAARPVHWEHDEPPPPIHLAPMKGRRVRTLGIGERALVRLAPAHDEPGYIGRVVKVLEGAPKTVLGVFRGGELGGRVISVEKKARSEFIVAPEHVNGARDGELVLAEVLPMRRARTHGLKQVRIRERHGDVSKPAHISL